MEQFMSDYSYNKNKIKACKYAASEKTHKEVNYLNKSFTSIIKTSRWITSNKNIFICMLCVWNLIT